MEYSSIKYQFSGDSLSLCSDFTTKNFDFSVKVESSKCQNVPLKLKFS